MLKCEHNLWTKKKFEHFELVNIYKNSKWTSPKYVELNLTNAHTVHAL